MQNEKCLLFEAVSAAFFHLEQSKHQAEPSNRCGGW